jgi:hypothetical protein
MDPLLEYERDIQGFPRFAEVDVREAATLFIENSEQRPLDSAIGTLFQHRVVDVHIVEEPEPLTQWYRQLRKSHAELAARSEHWQARHLLEKAVRRVELMKLDNRSEFEQRRQRAAHGMLLAALDASANPDMGELACRLARSPSFASSPSHFGHLPIVLAEILDDNLIVVVPEDGLSGRPGVGFYGRRDSIDALRRIATRDVER